MSVTSAIATRCVAPPLSIASAITVQFPPLNLNLVLCAAIRSSNLGPNFSRPRMWAAAGVVPSSRFRGARWFARSPIWDCRYLRNQRKQRARCRTNLILTRLRYQILCCGAESQLSGLALAYARLPAEQVCLFTWLHHTIRIMNAIA